MPCGLASVCCTPTRHFCSRERQSWHMAWFICAA
jgi:hypothetical protein